MPLQFFLPTKYKINEDKEYMLEDYKVIIPADKFFNIIKWIYLLDHCKAHTLRARVVDKYGVSIPT